MSDVRLAIRDEMRDLSGVVHGGWADRAAAACAADPETIDELRAALVRFAKPGGVEAFFRTLTPGLRDEPTDTGLIVVDLPARLVVFASDYSEPLTFGEVYYHDGDQETETGLPFHLDDEWLMITSADGWRELAEQRRNERAGRPPLDVRAVFYGRPLLAFIAEGVFERIKGKGLATEAATPYGESPLAAAVREVHADWLLTPREDLGGSCPREVAMERRDHVTWDLQHRANRWSFLGECPPGLDCPSRAYRFGGFGIHELVIYYDLVRELLWACVDDVEAALAAMTTGDFVAAELPRLEQVRDAWLDAPDPEFGGRTPRSVIERERRRIPEGGPAHEAIVDPDCPCCQMLAELPGPMFWHLDGCNMDDEFAFDIYHKTREEWEAEQRRHEEWSREFEAKEAERKRLAALGIEEDKSPWQSSFVATNLEGAPLEMRLFGVGSHLAELVGDLRRGAAGESVAPEGHAAVDRLNREFGNLREVLLRSGAAAGEALLDPVLDGFIDALDTVAGVRPDLEAKCRALDDEVRAATRLLSTALDQDDDFPF